MPNPVQSGFRKPKINYWSSCMLSEKHSFVNSMQ